MSSQLLVLYNHHVELKDELFNIFSRSDENIIGYSAFPTNVLPRKFETAPLSLTHIHYSVSETYSHRKVYNVFDMIADIGGILEFTQVFFIFVVKIFTSNLYQSSTVQQYSTKMASKFTEESHFSDHAKTKNNLNLDQPGGNSDGIKKLELITAKIDQTQNDIKNRELAFQKMEENKYK